MVTAFAIQPEHEKWFDSDAVSCIANLANMTSEEKTEINRLRKDLKGDISSARTSRNSISTTLYNDFINLSGLKNHISSQLLTR